MAKSNKRVLPVFEGKQKEQYERLMRAREIVMGQMQHHAEDALDIENTDKRGVTTHMADMSSDNSRHEMELRLLTEEGNVLQMIEEAIERLIDGEYGRCIECGDQIPEKRLEIRPHAIYCVKCKSRFEKMGYFSKHD